MNQNYLSLPATEFQSITDDAQLASQIESLTLANFTGPLSDEPSERAAQIEQAKFERRLELRKASRLRRGLPIFKSNYKSYRIDGWEL